MSVAHASIDGLPTSSASAETSSGLNAVEQGEQGVQLTLAPRRMSGLAAGERRPQPSDVFGQVHRALRLMTTSSSQVIAPHGARSDAIGSTLA
jgi:hypothetical protein